MKIIVRCFVLALAVTGIVATTSAKASSANTAVSTSKVSTMLSPKCPPDEPGSCGIEDSGL